MDPYISIHQEWRRRMESSGFNTPGTSQSFMRQPPPAHFQETMYVAERTASHSSTSTPLTLAQKNDSLEDIYKKEVERTMQQLQDKLHMNLMQSQNIVGSHDKGGRTGNAETLHQLALHQQQMVQLQLSHPQHPYSLHQSNSHDSQGVKETEDEATLRLKQETNESGSLSRRDCSNGSANLPKEETPFDKSYEKVQLLFGHGLCKWPGCDTLCGDVKSFIKHLNKEHTLDDRSTAQARVQMQVVSQLELQLQKERDRLQAMMIHLHLSKQQAASIERDISPTSDIALALRGPVQKRSNSPGFMSPSVTTAAVSSSQLPIPPLTPQARTALNPLRPNAPSSKRRLCDKSPVPISGGLPYMLERAGLDVQQEIQRNRDFYKNADVRPPFTYASLIRQSIVESPDKQLTLNEIYNWFQNTFCYFRRNAATWKNAIRTNLSLHKCFVRYEDDFGSFWMVDDAEFVKRRHLSRGRPRKYDPSHCSTTIFQDAPSEDNVKGSRLYNDCTNPSLQVTKTENMSYKAHQHMLPLHSSDDKPTSPKRLRFSPERAFCQGIKKEGEKTKDTLNTQDESEVTNSAHSEQILSEVSDNSIQDLSMVTVHYLKSDVIES